jgi:hypothetical protein
METPMTEQEYRCRLDELKKHTKDHKEYIREYNRIRHEYMKNDPEYKKKKSENAKKHQQKIYREYYDMRNKMKVIESVINIKVN